MAAYDTFLRAQGAAVNVGDRRRAEAEDLRQRNALLQAGQAYAGGDFAGAQSALAMSGNLEGAMAMQDRMDRGRREGQAEAEAQQTRQRETLIRGARALRYLPADQRWSAYQTRILPELRRQGFSPELLAEITAQTMDDRSLDSVISSQGGEVAQPRYLQGQRGALDAVDPYTGAISPIREPQRQEPPSGYRWGANGGLEFIPGGPADPKVAAPLATARRAPPRPGAAGGGSGGSSTSQAPAGRPWERRW